MKPIKVIDAVSHAADHPAVYNEYLDERFVYRRRIVGTNKTFATWFPSEPYDRRMSQTLGKWVMNPKQRLKDMDLMDIDVSIMYPTAGLSVSQVREASYAAALCRAYNNWSSDQCKHSRRLKAAALLPLTAPELCAAELNRAVVKLGLIGGVLAVSGLRRSLSDPAYFPLYEEAQRLNVPLSVHASGGDEPGSEILSSFIAVHTCGHPFPILRQLTGLLFDGIFERFPKLTFAFLTAGCGWLPYWANRMDKEYKRRAKEAPKLKAKPSEHLLNGRIYYSCESDEKLLNTVIDLVGDDRIMYASDYPHWHMVYPESAVLIKDRKDLSEDSKRKILRENALRFYSRLATRRA